MIHSKLTYEELQTQNIELQNRLQNNDDKIVSLEQEITMLLDAWDTIKEKEFEINETQHKTGLGSWVLDVVLHKAKWSKEMYNIHGLDTNMGDLDIDMHRKFMHPLDYPAFENALKEAVEHGTPYVIDARIIRPDNTIRYVVATGEPIVDQNGKVGKIRGTLRDITDIKKISIALKESEARFKNIFAKHHCVMLLIEPESGNIIDANIAAAKFYGYTVQQLCTMSINYINIISPDELLEQRKKAIAGINNYAVFKHKLSNGEIRDVEVHSSPIEYDNTVILFSIIHDITNRKKVEEELRETKEQYKLLFNNAGDPIVIINAHGKIIAANDTISNEYGYTNEELLILSVHDLVAQESVEFIDERLSEVISKGNLMFESVHIRKDKTKLYTSVNCKKILYYGHEAILCEYRNITEQKKTELLIAEKNNELQNINSEKDKFFSIIAHDLKSPLNAVLALSDLLKTSVKDKNTEEIAEYTDMIVQSCNNATNLLKNLLDWSRAQTGRMTFNKVKFDLIGLINEIIVIYFDIAVQKKINILKELPPKLQIWGDVNMISTVLRNLISNAIKFTYPGGNITLSVTKTNSEALVKVIDNGVGIPEVALDKLFKISSKFSTSGTQNEEGTGLGLILCKDFINKHNGKIGVESVLGKGSTFWFSLPLE